MHVPVFDNAFLRALPGDPEPRNFVRQVEGAAWSAVAPTPVAAPRLLAHSREVAAELGFGEEDLASPAFAAVFGGNALLPGMQPYATNYGGHQFGHWARQLGDGRAIWPTAGVASCSSRAPGRRRIRAGPMVARSCAPRSANSCAARPCTTSASRPRGH